MALTSGEQQWLKHCARILGVKTPGVREDGGVHDIAYSGGVILLGKKFSKEPPNSRIRRQKLLHETIHATGVGHDAKARSLRYHSKPKDDWLSRELTDEVERMENPSLQRGMPDIYHWPPRYRMRKKLVQRPNVNGQRKNPAFILGIAVEPVIGIILTGIASLFVLRMIGRQ